MKYYQGIMVMVVLAGFVSAILSFEPVMFVTNFIIVFIALASVSMMKVIWTEQLYTRIDRRHRRPEADV